MNDIETLGQIGFTDAKTYEQGRPGYPEEALRFFVDHFGLRPGSRVLDLGAGTGKFTRQLLAYGLEVVAVEPSETMRAELSRSTPQVKVYGGTGESIPLPDAVCDAVFVAQAFHWFRPSEALAEIARVLRPAGGLGMIWNERDESVDWVRQLSVLMHWHERQPYQVGMDFRPLIQASGHFESVERHPFRHTQQLDRRGLLQRVASTSYIAAMEPTERESLLSEVETFIASFAEPFDLPYVTDVYVARRPTGGEPCTIGS